MSDEISLMIPGRPGRLEVNVHLLAMSCRCHRRIVSGVTIVATCRKTRRPSWRPFAARRRRWSSVPEAAPRQLRLEDAVLLHQVFDDVLLVAIDPSGEGHKQHLQKGEVGNHSPILLPTDPGREATPRPNIRTVRGRLIQDRHFEQ